MRLRHTAHKVLHMAQVNPAIAGAIVSQMAAAGVDHDTLATRIGMTPSALMRRFTSRSEFRVGELVLIADALGCKPSQLIPDRAVAA